MVRPTAAVAVNLPSSGLSSSRLTLDIDTLEREYNSLALPPQLMPKLQQQRPVSIQTTSTPLPPPPLNGTITGSHVHPKTSSVASAAARRDRFVDRRVRRVRRRNFRHLRLRLSNLCRFLLRRTTRPIDVSLVFMSFSNRRRPPAQLNRILPNLRRRSVSTVRSVKWFSTLDRRWLPRRSRTRRVINNRTITKIFGSACPWENVRWTNEHWRRKTTTWSLFPWSRSTRSTAAKSSICWTTRNVFVCSKIRKVSFKSVIAKNNKSNQLKMFWTSFNVSWNNSLRRQSFSNRWKEYSNVGHNDSQRQFVSISRCSADHLENIVSSHRQLECLDFVVVVSSAEQQQSGCSSSVDERSRPNVSHQSRGFGTRQRHGQRWSSPTNGRFRDEQISSGIERMSSSFGPRRRKSRALPWLNSDHSLHDRHGLAHLRRGKHAEHTSLRRSSERVTHRWSRRPAVEWRRRRSNQNGR